MQPPEPVVGEADLVALDLDGVGGQGGEVGHAQHVELLAVGELDPEHGDPVEDALEHRELLHVEEGEGETHDGGHLHLGKVEPGQDLEVLETEPFDLGFM